VAVISDVAFIGNSVSGPVDWRPYLLGLAGGGALFVFGSDASGGASVNVLGCSFTNNSVNATDLYPPDSHDNTGQGSLTKGVWLLHRFVSCMNGGILAFSTLCYPRLPSFLSSPPFLPAPKHPNSVPCTWARVGTRLVRWWRRGDHIGHLCYGRPCQRGGVDRVIQLRWCVHDGRGKAPNAVPAAIFQFQSRTCMSGWP
jgi:hypothetical protein